MTLDIALHEVCVRVGVRYVITKFSRMDSLPTFVTHGAPLARFARESSAIKRFEGVTVGEDPHNVYRLLMAVKPVPNVCQGFHFQPISRTVSIIIYRKIIYNLRICNYD